MDRRELDRAIEVRDAFRALLPHRGGRIAVAICGLGFAMLLSMLVRVIGSEPINPAAAPRAASVAQRHAPVLPPAPAVEAGRSDLGSAVR